MAKTGEKRKTNQPLKIDRLPASVHDAILYLRNHDGKTWQEIEAQSAAKYSKEWKYDAGGFVEWDEVSIAVLELFPEMRLPHSSLHRWYDLRVEQVKSSVLQRSAQAREVAEAFARSVVKGGNEAVLNAARDTFMTVLAEDATDRGRINAGKALIVLAEVMQSARANDIKERKVAVDERKLAALEAEAERKRKVMEDETARMTKKASKGQVGPEDIDRLRERVFGLPPIAQKAG